MIIPSIWENKTCSKPPTRFLGFCEFGHSSYSLKEHLPTHVGFQQEVNFLLKTSSTQHQTCCLLVPPSIVSIISFGLCQGNGNRLLQPNSQLNASIRLLIKIDQALMRPCITTRSNSSLGPEQLLRAGDLRSHSRTVGDTW